MAATSAIRIAPTKRPLPLRVWKERLRIVSASLSAGSSSQRPSVSSMRPCSSRASSRKMSRNSGSIWAPVCAEPSSGARPRNAPGSDSGSASRFQSGSACAAACVAGASSAWALSEDTARGGPDSRPRDSRRPPPRASIAAMGLCQQVVTERGTLCPALHVEIYARDRFGEQVQIGASSGPSRLHRVAAGGLVRPRQRPAQRPPHRAYAVRLQRRVGYGERRPICPGHRAQVHSPKWPAWPWPRSERASRSVTPSRASASCAPPSEAGETRRRASSTTSRSRAKLIKKASSTLPSPLDTRPISSAKAWRRRTRLWLIADGQGIGQLT